MQCKDVFGSELGVPLSRQRGVKPGESEPLDWERGLGNGLPCNPDCTVAVGSSTRAREHVGLTRFDGAERTKCEIGGKDSKVLLSPCVTLAFIIIVP
ncbi:hypothetical protein TorRG33x02_313290 [Trema orientale]|uniref:Uncharacterized protein n=1 Tax=Trema orientale TaxID=63057 RepID=A0A2P5BPV2_TREOI|nr:hypothetical protein TorRG33x02_313290 [Trema orientale]